MSQTFVESERLSPDDARQFIQDLTMYMRERAWEKQRRSEDSDLEPPEDESDPSLQKQYYGDKWTFLYGIAKGMELMKSGSKRELTKDGVGGWQIDDGEWQEHHEQYGYGKYGEGLEIGKKLAFYEDTDFEFTSSVEEKDSETSFEFTDYSE